MVVIPVHPNTIWLKMNTENGKNVLQLHIYVKDNLPLPQRTLCFPLQPPSYAQLMHS